jgi:pimeloyl-ACP methyl ester carboxylesterase
MSEPRSQDFFPFQSAEARERFLARYAEQEADWPVPFEGRVVTSDHGETFVRISGPGEATPLLLLPGAASSSLAWKRLIEPLSTRFRIYAVDAIYDVGCSVPVRPVKDIDDLTAWLDAVLDGLGLREIVDLMGLSFGAYAIAEYALHAPERVRKMVWLSPAMIVAPISPEFVERISACAVPGPEPLRAFTRWAMPGLAGLDERELEERVADQLLIHEAYAGVMPPVGRAVFSDEELRSIRPPVLYIVGECDGVVEDARAAVARVNTVAPAIETVLIPGAGHDAIISHTQLIADRVLQFLDE